MDIESNLHLPTDDFFRFQRVGIALFRATVEDDDDALAVLEAQAATMPRGDIEAVETIMASIFAMAAQMPPSKGPEEVFAEYSLHLDQWEAKVIEARKK